MSRLGFIRIATYAVLVLVFLLVRDRMVLLPVDLADPHEIDEMEEARDRAERHEAIPKRAGFEKTKRSGGELMRIAQEYAEREGIDLQKVRPPVISLYSKDGVLRWSLHFATELPAAPGGFFDLVIDDETAEVVLHPGM